MDALKDHSFCETGECKVVLQVRNLRKYNYESIYLKLGHIVDPSYPLCNICEKHSKDVVVAVPAQQYHYIPGPMTVLFSVDLNSAAS